MCGNITSSFIIFYQCRFTHPLSQKYIRSSFLIINEKSMNINDIFLSMELSFSIFRIIINYIDDDLECRATFNTCLKTAAMVRKFIVLFRSSKSTAKSQFLYVFNIFQNSKVKKYDLNTWIQGQRSILMEKISLVLLQNIWNLW